MKKLLSVLALTILVWGCAKKMTPATTTTTRPGTNSSAAIAGKIDYTAKCARCHELKDPADYTANDWVPILDKMARKAKLDDTEKANVLAYVQANAKQ